MRATKSPGLGFIDILQIAFIILKLCNVITWSWWLVLAPFWILLTVTIIVGIYCVCVNRR